MQSWHCSLVCSDFILADFEAVFFMYRPWILTSRCFFFLRSTVRSASNIISQSISDQNRDILTIQNLSTTNNSHIHMPYIPTHQIHIMQLHTIHIAESIWLYYNLFTSINFPKKTGTRLCKEAHFCTLLACWLSELAFSSMITAVWCKVHLLSFFFILLFISPLDLTVFSITKQNLTREQWSWMEIMGLCTFQDEANIPTYWTGMTKLHIFNRKWKKEPFHCGLKLESLQCAHCH